MRFYFGFSKKIPIKWIIGAILAVLAFFGLTKVHALEITDMDYVSDTAENFNEPYRISLSQCGASGTNNYCTLSIPFARTISHNDAKFVIFKYILSNAGNENSPYSSSEILSYSVAIVSNNVSYICQSSNGYIICPIKKGVYYDHLNLLVSNAGGFAYLTILQRIYYYNDRNSSINNTIIDNQQQIIDSQNDTNNLLNDDDVSESSSSADDFFSDFEVSDTKGITSVITAPITFLRDLLTYSPNTCNPLTFDLTMKDDNLNQTKSLSLPCGSVLWSRAPNAVVALYSAFIWGVLGYRVLIGLNKFYNDIFNPESISEYYLDL